MVGNLGRILISMPSGLGRVIRQLVSPHLSACTIKGAKNNAKNNRKTIRRIYRYIAIQFAGPQCLSCLNVSNTLNTILAWYWQFACPMRLHGSVKRDY